MARANGVTPMFGWSNRSLYTVPVGPALSGVKALRATQTKAVRAASIPVSIGARSYPNGRKMKKVN